jgi:hypothetical protein
MCHFRKIAGRKKALLLFIASLAAFAVSLFLVPTLQKAQFLRDDLKCRGEARMIDTAKEVYRIASKAPIHHPVTMADIEPFMKDGLPICPAGAPFEINAIGFNPQCTLHGGFNGAPDFRDYVFPLYPFRKHDWLYIAAFFALVTILIMPHIRRENPKGWKWHSFGCIAAFLTLSISSLVLRDNHGIRRLGRDEWLRNALEDLKLFAPPTQMKATGADAIIEGSAWLKLADGWIYIITHSWHSDEGIGDVVICRDSRGNLYFADAHPCTGIIINDSSDVSKMQLDELLARPIEPANTENKSWHRLSSSSTEAALKASLELMNLRERGENRQEAP